MDIVPKKIRSQMMAGIKSKNTKPELAVRKFIFSLGYRYRINKRILGTRPDIILTKWKLCIFVHGCYWHRHKNCKLASNPKSNQEFWNKKFNDNIKRDKKNILALHNSGWKTAIIWECAVRDGTFLKKDLRKLIQDNKSWAIP